ncbi:solute carrier family 25 member 44-like [Penaeus monodon]|uniref:solute carrier family 25 member 44-like n=1 Tax=Penaeus monodon TaxID=6687 RepID=UPI0018A7805E|nr:solute carrier family 25 member 44-like [Penaeus monodon]
METLLGSSPLPSAPTSTAPATTPAMTPAMTPATTAATPMENGLERQAGGGPLSLAGSGSIFQRIRLSVLGPRPDPSGRESHASGALSHPSDVGSHASGTLSHASYPRNPTPDVISSASDVISHASYPRNPTPDVINPASYPRNQPPSSSSTSSSSSSSTSSSTSSSIRTIEWDMMDKWKFFPLSVLSSFSVRCLLYPFTVVKTRIQIQRHSEVYRGTFDAFRKISQFEGIAGLYRGFWVSAFQLVSGIFYITTYENVRCFLKEEGVRDSRLRALVGGGCASLVGQTIIVPFDVISQHMMVLGQRESSGGGGGGGGGRRRGLVVNPLNIEYKGRGKVTVALDIVKTVYRMDGLRGFYRGYLASISAYVPNSALWWTFYHFYQDQLSKVSPKGTSTLLLQCVAAPLGGVTTSLLTNPLDIIRARLQVQRTGSFAQTFRTLWAEEQLGIFTKGLSPRLFQSVVFSFMIILGYESVKRVSVSEEFKEEVRW